MSKNTMQIIIKFIFKQVLGWHKLKIVVRAPYGFDVVCLFLLCTLMPMFMYSFSSMHSSWKYPHPPHGRLLEIHRGKGDSKAKIFRVNCDTCKLLPKFGVGVMDIFWNNTMNDKQIILENWLFIGHYLVIYITCRQCK